MTGIRKTFSPASRPLRSLALAALAGSMAAVPLTGVRAEEIALPAAGPIPLDRPGAAAVMVAESKVDPARFGSIAESRVPTPLVRPAVQTGYSPAAAPARAAQSVSRMAAFTGLSALAASQVAPARGTLKQGLQALSDRTPDRARAIRAGMAPGTLDRKILSWAIAYTGGDRVPAGVIAGIARDLSDWPGMDALVEKSEAALLEQGAPARDVTAAFATHEPQTNEGWLAYAIALARNGDTRRAAGIAKRLWRTENLNRDLEKHLLSAFSGVLTRADHKRRMDMLLYDEWTNTAGRVADKAGARALYEARTAVIKNASDQESRLSAVPKAERADPGYRLAMVEYYRKHDRVRDAARLLLEAPTSADVLVAPDAWWNERRIVVRDLLDLDEPQLAYRVAAGGHPESAVERVEAAFHAGWVALRWLHDPSTARRHFEEIVRIADMPISTARGYYWLGRAAEAGGGGDAASDYRQAARYDATYYGQLASAKLGRTPGPFSFPSPSAEDRQRFANREVVRAIDRLEQIGSDWRTDALYRGLADELESPGELALLSVKAESRGDYHLVLQIGKRAFWRGIPAPALAFPTGVIPGNANISASGKALAYAIARQESAFNPSAKSHAGALGLLQLLPGTARDMARQVGVSYSTSRLTRDAGYNATLGAAYLGNQIADFGGSYILTFAGYNAGPRRAKEWIERFGDPRGLSLDEVVDWVERIPYTETRQYVQRVMENYQVYKIRLGAGFDLVNDLRFGRHANG